MSNTTIETANQMTLLEEMKPLFVYIISYVLYERLHLTWEGLCMKVNFLTELAGDNDDFNFIDSLSYETPLKSIQQEIEIIQENEYYRSYQKPLRLEITFKCRIGRTYFHRDNAITINEIKTFKTDECVICLENKNNVLFCNCGHICVCKKCIEIERLTNCPVCKTKNKILRIIE